MKYIEDIKYCLCGGKALPKKRDVKFLYKGVEYTVKTDCYECPLCGECIFSALEARRIESEIIKMQV